MKLDRRPMGEKTTVWNLATDEEMLFTLEPVEALISAAILKDRQCGNLTNPITRERYRKMILFGNVSASIGDLAVKLHKGA